MTALARSAAKVVLVLQIPFVSACADTGPGGPSGPAGAHFAGVLTISDGTSVDARQGEAFQGALPMAGTRIDLVSARGATTVYTSGAGSFSSPLGSGAYTVRIAMSDGPALEFALDLAAGEALFAEARVDQTPAGGFTLNAQVFRDGDADGQPDDAFRFQVLDREQGDLTSGIEDVVTSEEEAEASVTLCHVPPGNPDAAHTVSVGAPAVPAHLAHGDTEGACDGDVVPGDDGTGEVPDAEEDEDTAEPKVLVCHVPPGNPENPHTIEVGESAVPAHLAHGDTEGACAEETPPAEGEGGAGEG